MFGSIIVLPGMIMILVTAGAPPNRRAGLMAAENSRTPENFYLLCQPCHVGPFPLFVWSLSSTQFFRRRCFRWFFRHRCFRRFFRRRCFR